MSNVVSTPTGGGTYDAKQVEEGKLMSALGYFPLCGLPTFLVPLLAAKENRYCQFHAHQGAVLYLGSLAAGIVLGIVVAIAGMVHLSCAGSILEMVFAAGVFVLMVIGIVNAFQGQAKELPFIGPYASKLPF